MWTSWWAFTKWRRFSGIKQSRAKVPWKPAYSENAKNKVVILSVTAPLPPRARGPSMKTSGSARPWRTHGQDHPIAGSTKRSKTRTQQQLLQSKSQLSGQATNRELKRWVYCTSPSIVHSGSVLLLGTHYKDRWWRFTTNGCCTLSLRTTVYAECNVNGTGREQPPAIT